VILVELKRALFTTTLIFVVAIAWKLIFVQTLLLPVIEPAGTVTHADPVQYWTSKFVSPYLEKVIPSVGSTGLR